jgi:hypothetical protein
MLMTLQWWRPFTKSGAVRRPTAKRRPSLEVLEDRQLLTTYTVTTTADAGVGSLRQEILDANAHTGGDLVTFNIPGTGVQTITPVTPLPAITDPVTINGYSQPGSAKNTTRNGDNAVLLIQLDGYSLMTSAVHANGLTIQAINCTVEGLVIGRFLGSAIALTGGSNNKVQGNFLGTDPTGTQDRLNFYDGVAVLSGSSTNLIGGPSLGLRNLLSGNGDNGVLIANSVGNRVQGNFIGTDRTGRLPLGNLGRGVMVTSADPNHPASNNQIGGGVAGAGNLIAGNFATGVRLDQAAANNNKVQGNLIGTDVTGNAAIGNGFYGIRINGGASHNLIGGTTTGAGNVISGNNYNGLAIDDALGGGALDNLIQGNYIGTNRAGTASVPNSENGVLLQDVAGNVVGGAGAGAGNLISGNTQYGVYVLDIARSGPKGNTVQGNLIGTDVTGLAPLRNRVGGIILDNASNNVIGGAAGNVISGNGNGVVIHHALASANKVQGNLIGVGKDGMTAIGNSGFGIWIAVAPGNVIGGLLPAARNVISANGVAGVLINDYDPFPGDVSSANNVVEGNAIGTQADGVSPLGNALHGVWIGQGSNHNAVGGTANGAGNTIAFNGVCGIIVTDTAFQNPIRSNAIYANGALGIDLGWDGVTLNDPGDTQGGPNGGLNFPVLTSATSSGGNTVLAGSYNSFANGTFTLQFFASPTGDPSGYGEGQTLLGSINVTTNASGNATFSGVTFPVALTPGEVVSATATAPGLNSSEFSADIVVTSGAPASPNGSTPRAGEPKASLIVWGTPPAEGQATRSDGGVFAAQPTSSGINEEQHVTRSGDATKYGGSLTILGQDRPTVPNWITDVDDYFALSEVVR